MKERAFIWWNKTISAEREALSIPEIQTPQEMGAIWPKLSPIIQSMLDPKTEEMNTYWISVLNILQKMFPNDSIPNPLDVFSDFVIFLFNKRDDINPANYKALERYIDTFCPEDDIGNFLNTKFIAAAAIIPNIIATLLRLHEKNHPIWVKYINQRGSVERIVDLFITFLNHSRADGKKASDCNENSVFLLELALFLTRILVETKNDINLSNDLISNFYSRLLKLIKYTNNEHSVTFLRCAIAINDRWLSSATQSERVSRLSTLIASTQSPRIIRPIVLQYSLKQLELGNITAKKLVTDLLKQSMNTIYELQTLQKIALNSDVEIRSMVIKFLSRKMISNKVMMHASASLLASLLEVSENDKEIREWFTLFVRSLFCFFKIAYARSRYMRRVLLLCQVLSSDHFDDIKWVQEIIINAASCAYAVGRKLDFLKSFFEIRKVTNASEFETLLTNLSNAGGKLKTFPFKANSFILLGNNKHRKKIKLPKEVSNKSFGESKLKGIGLSPFSVKYVYENFEAGPVDQQRCIFELEDFIEKEQEMADLLQAQREQKSLQIKGFPRDTKNMKLVAFKTLIAENEKKIYEYQNSVLSSYIKIALDIVSVMSDHPHLFADQKLLSRHLTEAYSLAPHISKLRREREMLFAGVHNAINQYEKECSMIPNMKNPSKADPKEVNSILRTSTSMTNNLLENYLTYNASSYNGIIKAAAGVFQNNVSDIAMNVILVATNFHNQVNLRSDESLQILIDSLIRNVFDKAYDIESHLCKFNRINNMFIEACNLYCQLRLNELKFRSETMRKISKYRTIGNLCTSFNISCSSIEFMNNPLDIGFALHLVIKKLPELIGVKALTNEELSQLLLGILAIDPPSNAVSISVFLNRFDQVLPYLYLHHVTTVYTKAIFSIINESDVINEQIANETERTPRSFEISSFLLRACEQSEE